MTIDSDAKFDASAWRGNWSFPTAVRFGPGRIAELAKTAATTGMRRPIVVTDPGLSGGPVVKTVVAALNGVEYGLFDTIDANPNDNNLSAALTALRAGDHDGVIAVGGGSALDIGKAAALLYRQRGTIWDYAEGTGDRRKLDANAKLPSVAIPTTAGTGSEVSMGSVIVQSDHAEKRILYHPALLPDAVIADPDLTIGMPRWLTVGTGMDALAHALEAYCAPGFNPACDGIAMQAMRLVHGFLERAARDADDREARCAMLAASSLAAVAFQKGLGAVHALSHPVGARFGTHHGTTNAVFLPYVLAFNKAAVNDRLSVLSRMLGLSADGYAGVQDWLLRLRADLDIPHRLYELAPETAETAVRAAIADSAAQDVCAKTNPLPLDPAAARHILDTALDGSIH